MSLLSTEAVVGTTVACSFILLGNAITQTTMSVPALLVNFPKPTSPSHAAAARQLGEQWPTFWHVGNIFFRPISALGIVGYGYAALTTFGSSQNTSRDWRVYAVAAACHLITVVHSAVNMQPLNAKLDALRFEQGGSYNEAKGGTKVDVRLAEYYARRWAKLNGVRIVMPLVAGTLALWQTLAYW